MNKSTKIILGIILILVIVLIAAGNYFYSYAVVPAKKDFLASGSEKNQRNGFVRKTGSMIKTIAAIGSLPQTMA